MNQLLNFLFGISVGVAIGYFAARSAINRLRRRRMRRGIGELLGFLKMHGEVARRVAVPAWAPVDARRSDFTVN